MWNLYLCPNKQQSNSVLYLINISQVFNIQRWIFVETAWSDASHLIDSCSETLTKRPPKKLSAHFESTPKTIVDVTSKITHNIKQRRTKHQSKSPRRTQLTHHHTEDGRGQTTLTAHFFLPPFHPSVTWIILRSVSVNCLTYCSW